METDIRLDLEDELEKLQESQVEDWIQRCFGACDPRYDSDWLSSIFELAMLQFSDNYEIRSACSQAGVMEARRLSEEGELDESIARLERVLESDPYCSEAFELMEDLISLRTEMEGGAPAPTAAEETPASEEAPAPTETDPSEEAAPAEELPGEEAPAQESVPEQEPVSEEDAAPVAEEEPVEEAVAPEEAPAEPDSEPVGEVIPNPEPPTNEQGHDLSFLDEDIFGDLNIAPASTPTQDFPSVDFLLNSGEVHPSLAAQGSEAPTAVPTPMATAPASETLASPGKRAWNQIFALPTSGDAPPDPTYESLVLAMAEKLRSARRFRSAARLLADYQENHGDTESCLKLLRTCLIDWVQALEQGQQSSAAAQVAFWAAQNLGGAEFQALTTRLGTPPPSSPMVANSQSELQQKLAQSPEDAELVQSALNSFAQNPAELQSLFRSVAVSSPQDHRHWLNLGQVYLRTGQPVLALVHTQRAIKLAPSQGAYRLLAEVYGALQQPQLQQQALQQVQSQA